MLNKKVTVFKCLWIFDVAHVEEDQIELSDKFDLSSLLEALEGWFEAALEH